MNHLKYTCLVILCTLGILPIHAQTPVFEAFPPHWWTGMKHNRIQLLISANQDLAHTKVSLSYPGVTLLKTTTFSNPNFIAIDIEIAPGTQKGSCPITFTTPGPRVKKFVHQWPIKEREVTPVAQGVSQADFLYLLMPDRFANGDPTNDRLPGYLDQTLNRDSLYHRHGGDLQGVIQQLNYLQDLGVSALWLTPVLENDMPSRTEHGYAFTHHYRVDKRLGGAQAYRKLSDELHQRGMKLIHDAVYNHVGRQHHLFLNPPDKDWFHQWPNYTNTTYKDQVHFDPYASSRDLKQLTDGWFTPNMPDWNHENPFVANFLIQHALWIVEEFRVDGFRIDTYLYNNLEFMNRCNAVLLEEYPNLTLFGETWVHGVVNQAYFVENKLGFPFKSNLPGVTDFQTNLYGIQEAVSGNWGWTNGVNRLWQTLSNDLVYAHPEKLVIFLDNHDLSRFYSIVGENPAKHKMGIAWLLTCRGIPQMYYGTEIAMKGYTNPDGWVRLDFPGGWPGDKVNKFTSQGRNQLEEDVYQWTRNLARYRLQSPALQRGKMLHYVPENGVYTYFRIADTQRVMVIMNSQGKEVQLDLSRFKDEIQNATLGWEPATGNQITLNGSIKIPANYVYVLELR